MMDGVNPWSYNIEKNIAILAFCYPCDEVNKVQNAFEERDSMSMD